MRARPSPRWREALGGDPGPETRGSDRGDQPTGLGGLPQQSVDLPVERGPGDGQPEDRFVPGALAGTAERVDTEVFVQRRIDLLGRSDRMQQPR